METQVFDLAETIRFLFFIHFIYVLVILNIFAVKSDIFYRSPGPKAIKDLF